MSWLFHLGMLGKGTPPNGAASFTALQCGAIPGRPRVFSAKAVSGTQGTIVYFLRWLGGIG